MDRRRNPFDQFMAEGEKLTAPLKLILRIIRSQYRLYRRIPEEATVTASPERSKWGLEQFLTWGLSVAFIGIGFALLTLPYQFGKARFFFAVAAVPLIAGFAFSASTKLYPRILVAVFGAVTAGLMVNKVNDWVTDLEQQQIARDAVIEQAIVLSKSKKPPDVVRTTGPAIPPIERVATFSVMIPFDTKPGAWPIPVDTNSNDPLFRTYMDFDHLARWGTVPDSVRETKDQGQITWQATPVSMNDSTLFFSRMLQCYLLASIDMLQRNFFTVSVGGRAQASTGIEPPNAQPYSHKKLSKMLSNNRFFRPFLYRPPTDQDQVWRMKPILMPKGTIIGFREEGKPTQGTCVVAFSRPGYYKAEFSVEPFIGSGVGDVGKYFVTAHPETVLRWSFIVTMRYSIWHPNDGTFSPESYVKWLDALYSGLSKKLVEPE